MNGHAKLAVFLPAWPGDGKWIAFVSDRFHLAAPTGSNPRPPA